MWVYGRWGKETLCASKKKEDVSKAQMTVVWGLGWGFWLCDLASCYLRDVTQEEFAVSRCSPSVAMKRGISLFLQALDQSCMFKASLSNNSQSWPGVAFAERWITLFCCHAWFLWQCCWVLWYHYSMLSELYQKEINQLGMSFPYT